MDTSWTVIMWIRLAPGGVAPADPLSPSLAGPHDPRSAPAGAPAARLAAPDLDSTKGMSTGSTERLREENLDRPPAVVPERPCSSAGEMGMRDQRRLGSAERAPVVAAPVEPAVLVLVEGVER